MNSRWEDDFDPDAYDDYKMASVERERLRQEHSVNCWIYIGTDIRHNDMAKIGLTAGKLGTRASSSQNPYFTLLCAFKVKEGTSEFHLAEIERSVKAMLASNYEEIAHWGSLRTSEWFRLSPADMRDLVQWFLYEDSASICTATTAETATWGSYRDGKTPGSSMAESINVMARGMLAILQSRLSA